MLCVLSLSSATGNQLQMDAALPRIVAQNLSDTISELQSQGGRTTWEQQSRAAEWIKTRFESFGVAVHLDSYEHDSRTWGNVIAEIKGTKEPEKYVVVMAHLDTRCNDAPDGSPGADDNGSGIAVLLEIARVLRDVPLDRSVLFCIFSNEEPGSFGSRSFVQEAKSNGMQIVVGINFDIVGYSSGSFAWASVTSQKRIKYRVKALWRAVRNYWVSLFNEKRAIIIAGRPANGKLVETASSAFARHTGLQVKPVVKDDCG
jgi:Zn-dependent M28 family amino/carboxypeptidase